MPYIGKEPANSFISFEKQVFTIVNSQTAYTLDNAVTNENDIRLVINNIVQEPGSGKAYTASGTTLTLSAALVNGTDEMYCVFLGKAVQTVNTPDGSVNTSKLVADAITEAKIADDAVESEHLNDNVISGQTELASAPASTDGGTLKRIDVADVGNTPAFMVVPSSDQSSIADNTLTQVAFGTEKFDTDSAFASNTFTVPSGKAGKYFFAVDLLIESGGSETFNGSELYFYINDTATLYSNDHLKDKTQGNLQASASFDLNAGDTVKIYIRVDVNSGQTLTVNQDNASAPGRAWWTGFRLTT